MVTLSSFCVAAAAAALGLSFLFFFQSRFSRSALLHFLALLATLAGSGSIIMENHADSANLHDPGQAPFSVNLLHTTSEQSRTHFNTIFHANSYLILLSLDRLV